MKKILIPVDGSALAEQALSVVSHMLDSEVELILARVISTLSLTGADKARDEAADYLEELKESFLGEHPDARVSTKLLRGTVADSLIDFAEDQGVGLIVITTLGAGGLKRWLMGSTAEKVVRYAHCPVLSIGRRSLEG